MRGISTYKIRNMKMKFLGLAVLTVLAASCNGGKSDSASTSDSTNVETTVEDSVTDAFTGLYKETLPAADCEGINTTLQINADSTYDLRSEYIGKKDGVFEQSGVYAVKDGKLLVLTTPSSGELIYYVKVDNGVMLSDSLATINQGELAEHYILKKQ